MRTTLKGARGARAGFENRGPTAVKNPANTSAAQLGTTEKRGPPGIPLPTRPATAPPPNIAAALHATAREVRSVSCRATLSHRQSGISNREPGLSNPPPRARPRPNRRMCLALGAGRIGLPPVGRSTTRVTVVSAMRHVDCPPGFGANSVTSDSGVRVSSSQRVAALFSGGRSRARTSRRPSRTRWPRSEEVRRPARLVNVCVSSSSVTRQVRQATCAPRQKWVPNPKAMWGSGRG